MGFLQKILCILTALAIYPATIVIPKQDNFDRRIIFPQERRVFEIKQYESYAERNKQISCLQKNVYFEAAVESTAGKLAVAHVTYNRVKNKYFPDNFCDVVRIVGMERSLSWKFRRYSSPNAPSLAVTRWQ